MDLGKMMFSNPLLLTFLALALALAAFWPRFGLLARWQLGREARRKALAEDALKHLHTAAWHGQHATLQSLAGALRLSQPAAISLVEALERQGWVSLQAGALDLTADGERLALEVIRAHRLWERYLADEAQMPLTAIHAEAERREHVRPPGSMQALAAGMGYPAADPHGDPIPTAAGRLARAAGRPLAEWPPHSLARIVHLEDEPEDFYRQMVAEGLRPGMVVQVVEAGAGRLAISTGEKVIYLPALVAANVLAAPARSAGWPAPSRTLADLKRGMAATVTQLDDTLQGFTRRRLLDLGLTPGVRVEAELSSLLGDPVAYRVRGALIALRREQAAKVLINEIEGSGS